MVRWSNTHCPNAVNWLKLITQNSNLMKYSPRLFHLMYVKGNTAINFVYCRTQKGAKNLMENLVKKAKSGDSGAFAQLIRMNTQSMYKVA